MYEYYERHLREDIYLIWISGRISRGRGDRWTLPVTKKPDGDKILL